ncbi:MAG: serine/threonine-protein kinase [Pirellulales bacterium]
MAEELSLNDRRVVVKLTTDGRHEAHLLAKLAHSNIVPVYSVEHDERSGLWAICMPYLCRTTLADLIPREDRRDADSYAFWRTLASRESGENPANAYDSSVLNAPYVDTVLTLIESIVEALIYVHDRRILHRDLKPSNILVGRDRMPRLIDFNLSVDDAELQYRVGGTLPYMSPEQIRQVLIHQNPRHKLNAQTDLYSIGVVFYELLCGRLPYDVEYPAIVDRKEAERILRMMERGPIEIREFLPTLDLRTSAVVMDCLKFDASDRPQTANALLDRVRSCKSAHPRFQRWKRSNPALWRTLLACLGIAFLTVVAFLVLRKSYEVRATATGVAALRNGRNDDALRDFIAAIQANPGHFDAHVGLGRAVAERRLRRSDRRLEVGIRACAAIHASQHVSATLMRSDATTTKRSRGWSWRRMRAFRRQNSSTISVTPTV